jgi:hypothetical protein
MDGDGGLALAVSARLSAAEGRRFAFTVGLAFLAVAAIAWWRGRVIVPVGAGGLGSVLLLAGLLIPTHLGPVYHAWMRLAHAISRVTTPTTMAVVYFGALTPIGVLMRAFGRNPLTAHHHADTAWVPRGDHRRSDLERQF